MKRCWLVVVIIELIMFYAVEVRSQTPQPTPTPSLTPSTAVVLQPQPVLPSHSNFPDSLTVDFYATSTAGQKTLETRFFMTVQDPQLRVRRFEFDFGDGGKERRDPAPVYEYTRPGIYSVALEVVAEDGRVIRIVKPDYIRVGDRLPQIDFSAEPMSGPAPLKIIFKVINIGGIVVRYRWLPDSVMVTTAADSLLYTYTQAGIYSVTLTAVGAGGEVTKTKKNFIVVTAPFLPVAVFSAAAVVADSTTIGSVSQKTFNISNVGSADLIVSRIVVAGADVGEFKISPDGLNIKPGSTGLITVTFSPTSRGLKSAAVAMIHNAPGSPSVVTLIGVGVEPPSRPPSADFNGSGQVGFDDFFLFAAAFGQPVTAVNKKFDLNQDGVIDTLDFFIFAEKFGK